VKALLERQSWISQYLKNPDVATVASKTRSTDPEPRSREGPWRLRANDGTDNTIADDTDFSAEYDNSIHRPTSPEAPQMTNSPPAVSPHHSTTPSLSAITTHPPNSPTVHSDISNPATPKPIAAGGSRDPPVPDAYHPGANRNEQGKGPSLKEPNDIDSTVGTTDQRRKACHERHGKKR